MFDVSDVDAAIAREAVIADEVRKLRRAAARAYSRGYLEAADSEAHELIQWCPMHRARLEEE